MRQRIAASADPVRHFPSSPMRPPRFCLYFRDVSNSIRAAHLFCTLEASKGFIDEVARHMPDVKPRWVSETQLDYGRFVIDAHRLEDIIEASSVPMPFPYTSWAAQIAGVSHERFVAENFLEPEPARKPRKKSRGDSEAPAERRSLPSPDSELVTAADLADMLRLSPGKVRSILRDREVAKPYSWTPGPELDKITALVKGAKR